jgi:hypothetical protein
LTIAWRTSYKKVAPGTVAPGATWRALHSTLDHALGSAQTEIEPAAKRSLER